jgi:hypothetical protein
MNLSQFHSFLMTYFPIVSLQYYLSILSVSKITFSHEIFLLNILAYLLKARTEESEKQPLLANGSETTFVSRQRLGTHATIKVLLETVFYLLRAKGF